MPVFDAYQILFTAKTKAKRKLFNAKTFFRQTKICLSPRLLDVMNVELCECSKKAWRYKSFLALERFLTLRCWRSAFVDEFLASKICDAKSFGMPWHLFWISDKHLCIKIACHQDFYDVQTRHPDLQFKSRLTRRHAVFQKLNPAFFWRKFSFIDVIMPIKVMPIFLGMKHDSDPFTGRHATFCGAKISDARGYVKKFSMTIKNDAEGVSL